MKRYPLSVLLCFSFMTTFTSNAKEWRVSSPDNRLSVTVNCGKVTTYEVEYGNKQIIEPSPISMTCSNGKVIGHNANVKKVTRKSANDILHPVIRQKSADIKDEYNSMELHAGDWSLEFRVYDDGFGYRFNTQFKDSINVLDEEATFRLAGDYETLFPEVKSLLTAQQPTFTPLKLSEIKTDQYCCTPLLMKGDDNIRVFISESDLDSYPGMFLRKQSEREFAGMFANVALEEKATPGRQIFPSKRANYIARTTGRRSFPWRAVIVADNDANLITNQLIYKLAPESKGDYSWVKPGKIAWDWYNDLMVTGVDFKSGINNETYEYFIDFASKYGLEYVVIDDGWSEEWDITKTIPDIDIPRLVAYGKEKGVDLILWVSWAPFSKQLDKALAQFEKWGIKGIKMDFMNRDDQAMVDFYYDVARKAAAHKLLVDFHGAYKPTGWLRTFPNVLTSEGVAGLENHKWSSKVTPQHNLILPFTRMVAGPMDYTPGSMTNLHEKSHKVDYNHPASIGTRCHQLGMYVVYESPLQMLADSPTKYYREPECMEFLSQVPVVWDETKVIQAKIGEYTVIARRSGDTWYIGGMCGKEGKSFDIPLDFIEGNKTLTAWEDGVNVDRDANDFARRTKDVKAGDILTINMYSGGGYAAVIR